MRTILRIAVMVVLASAGLAASDPAYVGKWKFNPDKSDFGQTTVNYVVVPGGYKTTMDGKTYTFMTDNKDTPTPWGTTTAWKVHSDKEWEAVNKVNGQLMSTDKIKLSDDGNTLTVESKVMKATGGSSDDVTVFRRVSGGPGLAGTWKADKMKTSSPGVLEISRTGTDGLRLTYLDQGGMCEAKFNGADAAAAGKMWPAGWTCSLSSTGDRSFDVTWKKDGTAMYKSAFSVSQDGKTLTEQTGAVATSEVARIVYDKQ